MKTLYLCNISVIQKALYILVFTEITKELLQKIDNRFELVIVVAKRARQISGGQIPLTRTTERSAVTLAANEIAEGKVKEC